MKDVNGKRLPGKAYSVNFATGVVGEWGIIQVKSKRVYERYIEYCGTFGQHRGMYYIT